MEQEILNYYNVGITENICTTFQVAARSAEEAKYMAMAKFLTCEIGEECTGASSISIDTSKTDPGDLCDECKEQLEKEYKEYREHE